MQFTIFVTERCNLRCTYCYEQGIDIKNDMDIRTANKTLEFIYKKIKNESLDIPLYIVLHGGEPLINIELVKYIQDELSKNVKDRKVIYDMTINGTLLDEEKIDFICKKIDNISVSIDGTKESHDRNRIFANGSGTYDLAIKNTKKLLDKGKDVRVRMTYSSNTVSGIYDGVYELVKHGFKNIVPAADFRDTNWNKGHLDMINEQISKLINIKQEYPNVDISLIDINTLNRKKGSCFGGITGFTIGANGDIFPCTICIGNDELKLGNVFDTDINESKDQELFNTYNSKNDECTGCIRKEFCDASRCKIINKVVTGDFNNPISISCSLQRVYLTTIKKLRNQVNRELLEGVCYEG